MRSPNVRLIGSVARDVIVDWRGVVKTYRVGLVGAGFMGRTHAWCWRSLPFFYEPLGFRCEVHGVCTSRPETAAAACENLGIERAYATVEEMAADPAIDIIDIASPNSAHAGAILAAQAAGKLVYCDKPITGSLAQAQMLADAIPDLAAAGQMVFHNRFFPATMRARQMVEAGELGEVIGFRGLYLHSGNVAPGKPLAWKDMKAYGAGVLYDLGSHVLDLLVWVCASAPTAVCARQRTLNKRRPSREDPTRIVEQDTDDQTVVLATLAGGAVGIVEASKIATGAQDELRLEVHGTRGALRFSLMDPNYLDWFDASDSEAPLGGVSGYKRIHCVQRYAKPAVFPAPKATIGWLRGHLHCLWSFVSSVDTGAPFEPSLAHGVRIEHWLDAIQRSADLGVEVSITDPGARTADA